MPFDRARLFIVLAAVLWSLSSVFMRLLSEPTGLGLDDPKLTPLQIAFFRGLFAGLLLIPFLRRVDVRVRPTMVGMMLCFGVMSGLYLSALGLGSAANAILLQNTAPFWVYIIGVYLLGDPSDVRSWRAILLGMVGALLIVAGNWPWDKPMTQGSHDIKILFMATGSGIAYAIVILFLRYLRAESGVWLITLNLLGSAGAIGGFVLCSQNLSDSRDWFTTPTVHQLVFIAFFGAVQMAAPYLLFTYGLRTVSPQEAGIITLLEPVLNPIWAYLVAPDRETPTMWTWLGGMTLLAALTWRYFPTSSKQCMK